MADVNYDERSIWQNMFDPGAWENLIKGTGSLLDSLGIFDSVAATPPQQVAPPTYQAGILPTNLDSTTLLIGGGVLLLVLLLMRK